jgi:hypothetical protein
VVEEVEQLLLNPLSLARLQESLLELKLAHRRWQRGQWLSLPEDCREEYSHSLRRDLSLLGEIAEHLLYLVIRHQLLYIFEQPFHSPYINKIDVEPIPHPEEDDARASEGDVQGGNEETALVY